MSDLMTVRTGASLTDTLAKSAALDLGESAVRIAQAEVSVEELTAALAEAKQAAKDDFPAVARYVAGNAAPNGVMPGKGSRANDWRKEFHASLVASGLSDDATRKYIQRMVKVGLLIAKFPELSLSVVVTAVNSGNGEAVNAAYALDKGTKDEVQAILTGTPVVKRSTGGMTDVSGGNGGSKGGSKGKPAKSDGPAERLAELRAIKDRAFPDKWTAEALRAYSNGLATHGAECIAKAREAASAADALRDMANA